MPSSLPFNVSFHELLISFITGGIFGLLGYFLTRHINNWLEDKI